MPQISKPLELTGTPRERGRIHGESLRPMIHEGINRWKQKLAKSSAMNPDEYLRQFLAGRNFVPALQKWAPGLVDEIIGIGEGAGVDYQTIYAWQLVDEEWIYDQERVLGPVTVLNSCSALGVLDRRSKTPLLAQNMDLPAYYHGLQTILRIKFPDSDLETLIFTIPGVVAVNGLNNAGVAVCVNTLSQLQPSVDGLPVVGVLRGILECNTVEKAEQFVRSVKHASGQNYMIGDPQGILCLESSAQKVVAFAPSDNSTIVYHTNHPIVNDDVRRFWNAYEKAAPELKAITDQGIRNSKAPFILFAA